MKNIFMKSISIISLLIFCSCISSNKNIEYRLLRLHYENSSGEKGMTTFDYDEHGKLNKAIWELLDGSRNSLNYYECDNNGNVTKKYREYSDEITSNEVFEYNESGNLITEHFHRSDSVSGVTNYEYDENSRLIKGQYKNFDSWLTGVITFNYNENNNLQK